MKTIERYLCADCAQVLRESQVVFRRIPNTDGQEPKCEWCRKKRFGSKYLIRYGSGGTNDAED